MRIFLLLLMLCISSFCFSQKKISYTVHFEINEAEPSQQSVVELQQFFKQLEGKIISEVKIEGHTDKKGTHPYNNQLAEARAQAIGGLLKPLLTPNDIINIQSFGKNKLLATESDKQDINRRVEIIVFYSEPPVVKRATELQPFFEDVETQRFAVNFDDTVIVTGKEGTTIKIAPGSIQTKTGKLIKSNAEIQLKEYYNPGDILLSGLNTLSGDRLLETGGMFSMLIIQGKDTMQERSLKPVSIRMPLADEPSGPMNVFARNHLDTTNWQNTDSVFSRTYKYWDFPRSKGKLSDWSAGFVRYENWKVGFKTESEQHVGGWGIFTRKGSRPDIKRYTVNITKVDSTTLFVKTKIRFRGRGVRKYDTRNFDTSFTVKYKRQEYIGFTYNVNWINCDRFLNFPNVTDYYVTTPDFNGANVMLYFKSQRAFMQAMLDDQNLYKVSGIPPGQDVWVVAFGKKDNTYYFSKKEFTTSTKGRADVVLTEVSKDAFHKAIKSF